MSESAKTIYLKDYLEPAFKITSLDLTFQLFENGALVKARQLIERVSGREGEALSLNGEDLELKSIKLDGRELEESEYLLADESLKIESVPAKFELQCETWIKPQDNKRLEGLYKSSSMFCTQCEAEGFRHITWYLDRPVVLSKFRTTVKANKKDYPILLSNGNDIKRGEEGEKYWVTWEDPFNKPAYLFALVAGDLECVEDHYTTMSGRNVKLQIFSEAHNIDKV